MFVAKHTAVLEIYILQEQTFSTYILFLRDRGSTVVKVLCYKSEGRWFDFSWCLWNFSLT
jgi:hypothetical protein